MIAKRIYLDPSNECVVLDTYVPTEPRTLRAAMLVLPGGGYQALATDREGETIALAFAAEGLASFVLQYRIGAENRFPEQLIDASRAMVHIRRHAAEYGIDPTRVYCVGFSAGGHLAGSLCTMHALPEVAAAVEMSPEENRPTAGILAYPVVSAFAPTHGRSFENLSGKPFAELTDAERRRLSLECHVDERTSPMFVWHTAEDVIVPPLGTMRLVSRLLEAKIPTMLTIYPNGPHGMGLGNRVTWVGLDSYIDPMVEGWPKIALRFFERLPKEN